MEIQVKRALRIQMALIIAVFALFLKPFANEKKAPDSLFANEAEYKKILDSLGNEIRALKAEMQKLKIGEGKSEFPVDEKGLPILSKLTVNTAPPYAQVIVDNAYRGFTPLKEIGVLPGEHRIVVIHDKLGQKDTTIFIGLNEDRTIRLRLFK